MTLSPPTRAAVLEVVRRLRDPMRSAHVDRIGSMLMDCGGDAESRREVREALGIWRDKTGGLAIWARGKSREEVAAALEVIVTSEVHAAIINAKERTHEPDDDG